MAGGGGGRRPTRPDQMLTTVSLWREDTCIAVFHLEPREAVRVITFLSANLAEVADKFRTGWSASA